MVPIATSIKKVKKTGNGNFKQFACKMSDTQKSRTRNRHFSLRLIRLLFLLTTRPPNDCCYFIRNIKMSIALFADNYFFLILYPFHTCAELLGYKSERSIRPVIFPHGNGEKCRIYISPKMISDYLIKFIYFFCRTK